MMASRPLLLLACASLVLGGCMKSKTTSAVAADGSATMSYDVRYEVEAVESARDRLDDMAVRMEEAGREADWLEDAEKRIDTFEASFSKAAIEKELKARGMTLVKHEAVADRGWRGAKVTAKVTDAGKAAKMARDANKPATADGEEGGEGRARGGRGGRGGDRGAMMMRRIDRSMSGLTTAPAFPIAFEKTDDAKVAKMVIVAPRAARPERQGGRGERGGRGGGGGGGRRGGAMGGMDMSEAERTMTMTLPGKVLEVQGCKKGKEPNTIVFSLKGDQMMGRGGEERPFDPQVGVFATFELPEGHALKLEKKGVTNPEPRKEGGERGERGGRRGGLRLGEGGGGR